MRNKIFKTENAWLITVFYLIVVAPFSLKTQILNSQVYSDKCLKYRWFFSFGYKRNQKDVEQIKALVDTAAAHGLNGMVLSSFGLDCITHWNSREINLLKDLAAHCEKKKIELIPIGFSVGYGGCVVNYHRSFAAALPVKISLKSKDRKIIPVLGENLLINGDLEAHTNDRFKGYNFNEQPGQISFADTMAVSGRFSIRFENFTLNKHGHGRIMQQIAVIPGHIYRFSFRIKTQELIPVYGLQAMVYTEGHPLTKVVPDVKSTQDWTEVTLDYMNYDKVDVKLYIGIWGGKSGIFWIDDLKFYEYGDLSNIARREGTPLVLKSKDRDKIFIEGKDFESIQCLEHQEYGSLHTGSSIKEEENLVLFCFKIPYVAYTWGKQISLCMSNPELYEYWKTQVKMLYEVIRFKKYLLSMDEIRNGGGCLFCNRLQEKGVSMAEILGDCITRQVEIFKEINPNIEVMIWSDMLDPLQNAHDKYYGIVGDFTQSWMYVPKDMTIICWSYKNRKKSLEFFSKKGFRTFGAAYYDSNDLTNSMDWLSILKNTPNAQGIMYTTWQKKYRLLGEFGNLVSAINTE